MKNRNPNRLIDATSPYLLQHAFNPVYWYPWEKEALQKAKSEDKPIIVSIGYSSCHWCHVMERESFENEEIAEIMNKNFICIKVDREERPDVDQIYMEAVQALVGQGGWPLNVFLTPDLKPFYGGTYFPTENFKALLIKIKEVFQNNRSEIESSASQITEAIQTSTIERYGLEQKNDLHSERLKGMFLKLSSNFDIEFGGMSRTPKFPMPGTWKFLLYYAFISKEKEPLKHIIFTLEQIAKGGIYDQVAGGFARYSTDSKWFAPHFEKMLYDNGQLMSLYALTYSITGNNLFKEILYETHDWLIQEMKNESGGFCSALDADSEGMEGKYYCWEWEEFNQLAGSKHLAEYFGVKETGNWENRLNILHRKYSIHEFCEMKNLDQISFTKDVKELKSKLLNARKNKVKPGLDDKVLSGWNGLMSSGLIDSYKATGDEVFIESALVNATFLIDQMWKNGTLYRTWKKGTAQIEGFLEDYAAVGEMLIKLYQATFDENWLDLSAQITRAALHKFSDPKDVYLYFAKPSADLIAQPKEILDNVIPASNSIIAQNLYFLGMITGNRDFTTRATDMVSKITPLIEAEPEYTSNWALLYAYLTTPGFEVAISGSEYLEFADEIRRNYFPNKVICGTGTKSEVPLLQGKESNGKETLVYVCHNHTCKLPVSTPDEAITILLDSLQV